jgi:hypothetical protein
MATYRYQWIRENEPLTHNWHEAEADTIQAAAADSLARIHEEFPAAAEEFYSQSGVACCFVADPDGPSHPNGMPICCHAFRFKRAAPCCANHHERN